MTFSTSFDEARVDGPAFADKFGMRCIWPTHEKTLIRPNERLNDLAANDASAALVPSGMVKRLAWETV
jgi:hypothetical protein